MSSKSFAVVAAVCSGLILSSGGVLVRSVQEADALQIAFYRAISLLATLAVAYVIRHGLRVAPELVRSGRLPLIVGPLQGLASVCFVVSLTMTSVASAVLMLSAVPIFASVIAWFVLNEKLERASIIAVGCTAVGVGLVLWGGVAGRTLAGDALALASSLSFATFVVMLRKYRAVDMTPALVVGAGFACLISGVGASHLRVPAQDLLICFFWGAVVQGAALSLFVVAARHLLAAELCLLTMLEFVLAPIWVWLAFGEVPARMSLMGGAIVLTAATAWSLSEMSRRSRGG